MAECGENSATRKRFSPTNNTYLQLILRPLLFVFRHGPDHGVRPITPSSHRQTKRRSNFATRKAGVAYSGHDVPGEEMTTQQRKGTEWNTEPKSS